MVALLLAASTTLLSFGLLVLSRVLAIGSFGSGMLIGITLAFFLAPLATRCQRTATIPRNNAPNRPPEPASKRPLPWTAA